MLSSGPVFVSFRLLIQTLLSRRSLWNWVRRYLPLGPKVIHTQYKDHFSCLLIICLHIVLLRPTFPLKIYGSFQGFLCSTWQVVQLYLALLVPWPLALHYFVVFVFRFSVDISQPSQ